jgi:hypothetical protein
VLGLLEQARAGDAAMEERQLVAASEQRIDDVTADEPRAADDEDAQGAT